MQRKKLLIGLLAIALLVGIVSAAVISYFGQVQMTATVKQAVLLDGNDITEMPIEETATVAGGESFCRYHYLKSQTSVPVELEFDTAFDPTLTDEEIEVKYYETLGYYKEETFEIEGSVGDLVVTVEDDGCWVTWTFDFPVEGEEWMGNGQISAFVAINLGGGTAFVIHNNDGMDDTYDWGTWLYSKYDSTCDIGFPVMPSNIPAANTPVSDIGWIQASGERYAQDKDGILQVKISKCELGETFSYIARSWTGSGWYEPLGGQYFTIGTENWLDWEHYEPAELMTEITSPFTLQPKERLDFYICYEFAEDIKAGTYTITTTVEPYP